MRKEIKRSLNYLDKQPVIKRTAKHVKATGKVLNSLADGLDFGKPKKVKKSFNSEGLRF